MSRASPWMLVFVVSCGVQPPLNIKVSEPTRVAPPPSLPSREVCQEPRRACTGFADSNPDDPALGASTGAFAADALFCGDIVKGHATRCPNNRDSRTQEHLCPAFVRGPEFPGKQVMCGPCRSTRAEMLAFGIKALVNAESLDALSQCASAGRCEAWRRCEEATTGKMKEGDWTADFLGWSLEPGRSLLALDPPAAQGDQPACRPHDAVTWPEALTFFVRLSGLTGNLRCSSLDVSAEANTSASALARGCRLRGIQDGDQPWIAAAVAFNNAGIYCLVDLPDGRRTADICGAENAAACSPTRYVMATIVARMRGDIELAACRPVDGEDVECGA